MPSDAAMDSHTHAVVRTPRKRRPKRKARRSEDTGSTQEEVLSHGGDRPLDVMNIGGCQLDVHKTQGFPDSPAVLAVEGGDEVEFGQKQMCSVACERIADASEDEYEKELACDPVLDTLDFERYVEACVLLAKATADSERAKECLLVAKRIERARAMTVQYLGKSMK